jgi:signal transduction histidine kinase
MRLVPRLTLYMLVPIGLVFALDTAVTLRSDLALLDSDARRDGALFGRDLAIAVGEVWRDGGEQAALEVAERWDEAAAGIEARIVLLDAPHGAERGPEVPDATARLAGTDRAVQVRTLRGEEPWLFTYMRIDAPDGRPAALELSEPLLFEETHVATRVPRKLATAAAMVLLCGIVAWWAGLRVVGRPVEQLIAKAHRIGDGDFHGPIEVAGRGEFADLAAALNHTAEMLADSGRRLVAESVARIAALEQLRHADRLTTVGKLAAGLAHELGTPLNVISGRAQMIATGESEGLGDVVHSAQVIRDQAERMTRIVRQLLDFARLRTGQRAPTEIGRLARDAIGFLAPFAGKHGVQLAYVRGEHPIEVRVDADQIQQALTNLIVNAVQASSRGSEVAVRILTRECDAGDDPRRAAGRFVVIEVEDTGVGIPAEQLPTIFDPFFTTKPVGEGTGLGLSVVLGIVEEHGGRVEVASESGRGSRFSVFLPADDT